MKRAVWAVILLGVAVAGVMSLRPRPLDDLDEFLEFGCVGHQAPLEMAGVLGHPVLTGHRRFHLAVEVGPA